MKILFINFNLGSTAGINNGIAVLSAVLKEKGHRVGLIFLCEELGYGFDLARIKKDVLDFQPDIIGISLVEPQLKYMARFCKDLRKYYKGFVVCGGPHPTMSPEDVLSVDGMDAVCVGEGEDAIAELAEKLKLAKDRTQIKNLWFKLDNGTVIKNRLRPFKKISDLPAEDKELFGLDKIIRMKNYQLEVSLGRGCPYGCSYCINKPYLELYKKLCDGPTTPQDYIRIKNADTVISEIKSVVLKHPKIRKIAFIDDDLLMYAGFVKDFFTKYRKEVVLPFMCNANPLSFDIHKGRFLKEAGCDDVRFGVESGSERIKKDIMNRPISNRRIKTAFKAAGELGLMASSFNMIGLPTETMEEVLETLKLNAAIMPDTVKVMTFYPFGNTPIYDICARSGLIDYEKKRELDNYDTFTCLKFTPEHQLFLKKVQVAFNWYINIFMRNESSRHYLKAVKDIEAMDGKAWEKFDFDHADKEISDRMKKIGAVHYFKFMNRSLAAKFPGRELFATK